jgi:hypothetical protein
MIGLAGFLLVSLFPVGAATTTKGNIKESTGRVRVNTGGMEFVFDPTKGVITDLSVQDKTLIANNAKPMLFATVMDSAAYDGFTDYAPRQFISAEYSCKGFKLCTTQNAFAVHGTGSLTFPGKDALDYELDIIAPQNAAQLNIIVSLTKRGNFKNRFISDVGVRQPLALDHRKRIVQAGDQGLRWDTRYCYQFHGHTKVFRFAEQNWWRHFYIDQDTEHSYHVWRAESGRTSPLSAFHGRRAAGWMTLYDQKGGALFAYRDISARVPKLLYAGAEKGGEGVVYLYGPTQPAFDPSDPRLSAAVFGKPHEINWIFFAGKEAEVKPDSILARAWGKQNLPSDGPTKFTPVADEINLWNAANAASNNVPLVMGGLPLPKGSVFTPDQVRVFVRGREAPLQAKPIAFWPDGGTIKWLLLMFPLDGDGGYGFSQGTGKDKETSFRVTLRQGNDVPCTLQFGKGVHTGTIKQEKPLLVQPSTNTVEIDTGPMQLTLTTGECWMSSVKLNGTEMLKPDNQPQAFVDFLRVASYPVGTTHAEGKLDAGPVNIERVDVEESGPLRAVVRLEGKAMCTNCPPRVIMRAEFYKGRSFIRLFHTVEFMHNDLRNAFVRNMGLRLPLALDTAQLQATAGGQHGPVTLKPASAVGLRQTSHVNYEAWRMADNGKYREITDTGLACRGWLAVGDGCGGLAVGQRSMWQEAPKELLFRRQGAAFEIGLWPASSPLMDVRRYSEYPHPSQGEAAADPQDPQALPRWIEKYYESHPFSGVTRTHETLLYFYDKNTSPAEIDMVAADFQSQPLVYAGWPWYASVGITFPQANAESASFARFNANLENTAEWWMFHQKAWGWYGIWDYGDVRHWFRTGYGWILPPDQLAQILDLPPEEADKVNIKKQYDYFTQNDWPYDNGRWGWSNTEGILNHFMSQQYLRTGRRDLFFFMEAYARHVRDVDARHAGKWFGCGTRHGVQHWSDGNHEERQTCFAEQRFHYLLTGEHRTYEWNRCLTDNFYLKTECGDAASHSGRSYGLLFNWEITGDPKVGDIMRRYMSWFAQPNGIDTKPRVKFPEAERVGPPGFIHGSYAKDGEMFFMTFGAMYALLEYYYLTHDERLRNAIIKTADYGLELFAKNVKQNARKRGYVKLTPIAFAARHAADKAPYLEAVKSMEFMRSGIGLVKGGYQLVYQQVPANRALWTGPSAFYLWEMAYGWLNDAAYMLGALEAEPPLTPEQEKVIKDLESRPVELEPRAPRESWQTEYDVPKFENFIRDVR